MTARVGHCARFPLAGWVCVAALLGGPQAARAEVDGGEVPPPKPATPYQIRLGPRQGEATPQMANHSQTGGGYIDVSQPAPNVVVFTLRGAAVAGGNFKPGVAALAFALQQEFAIVPTRPCQRPPRLGMAGRLVGTLDSSEHCLGSGSADHAPACASVVVPDGPIVDFSIPSQGVAAGEKVFLNKRAGPVEAIIVPGKYSFRQSFQIAAAQSKNFCHKASVADFDPAPKLDPEWQEALKAFRAVPRQDFGYRVVLWVIEDPQVPPPPASAKPAPKESKESKESKGK